MKSTPKFKVRKPPTTNEGLLIRLASAARQRREALKSGLEKGNHLAEADVFKARLEGEIYGLEEAFALVDSMGDFVSETKRKSTDSKQLSEIELLAVGALADWNNDARMAAEKLRESASGQRERAERAGKSGSMLMRRHLEAFAEVSERAARLIEKGRVKL